MENKNNSGKIQKNPKKGFTLIELLVVVAIIGLLASVALIALASARQKSRNAKRLADMVQSSNALELYFATFKGYPSATSGLPSPGTVVPNYASTLPSAPQPADGGCDLISYSAPASGNASQYYYVASGTPFTGGDGITQVYPDYAYYFCLGNPTGNFNAGVRIATPHGVQ